MRLKTTTIILFLLSVTIATAAWAQEGPRVKDLMAKLPADDVAAAQQVVTEIVKLGPDATKELAAMLVPTGKGNDAKVRFALNGLAHHVSRPGAEKERAAYARAIIDALSQDRPSEVRAFLISMLQRAGRDESVHQLAKFLTDEELGDAAARALASMHTKSAGEALAAALPSASAANQASILRALGDIRHAPGTPTILPFAKAADPVTRGMALYALANIGAPDAADVLAAASAEASSRHERSHVISLYLLLAERLAEAGQKPKAAAMCRELIKGQSAPPEPHIVSGALTTLAKTLGPDSLDDLAKALDREDKTVRAAALELMLPMTADRVTSVLAEKLEQGDFEKRTEIVRTLGRRSDAKSRAAVVSRLKDEDKLVRLAAVEAVARQPNDETLNVLLQSIRRADAEEARAISEALQRIPGDKAMASVAGAIPEAPPPAKIALLETLAARHARGQVDRVIAAASKDDDAGVRIAAIKALRDVGSTQDLPRLLELVPNANDEKEQLELMQTIVAVSLRNPDAQQRAQPLLAAMSGATGPARRAMLRALPQLGGQAALDAVVAESRNIDKESKDAAVRALADWRDDTAAERLLELARSDAEDQTNRILALRGYIRLAGINPKRPATEAVAMYRQALAAATRTDDKRLAISGLASVRHIDALKLVADYAADEELGPEAALAALKIVAPEERPRRPLTGDEVTATLEKIAADLKDDAAREKIKSHLEKTVPKAKP